MTDADNQLSKDNGTLEDAELRAKKAALQKALADAIEACTGTKVDPASLTLTDEDVSFPKENISANKDVLNRTYVYTASDGKKYTFTYNFVYNDKPSSVSGAGYKGAGYFMDGIHVGTEEIVADADGKTDHKSTLIESGVFVSGNATTDANGAYTTITKDSPLYGLGVDFKTAPKTPLPVPSSMIIPAASLNTRPPTARPLSCLTKALRFRIRICRLMRLLTERPISTASPSPE